MDYILYNMNRKLNNKQTNKQNQNKVKKNINKEIKGRKEYEIGNRYI